MKTADEIRRHLDNLKVCMTMPCQCRGTAHEEKCIRGMSMMKAVAETLGWCLGQNEAMQDLVDRMASDVAEYLASN